MKPMKSIYRVCLLAVLLVALLVVPAAAEELQLETAELHLIQNGEFSVQEEAAATFTTRAITIDDVLYAGLSNIEPVIDVSGFRADINAVVMAMTRVINNHPDLFYVSELFSYSKNSSGQVLCVYPQYTMEGQELLDAIDYVSNELNRILAMIDPSWSELETVLFINDYLASHYYYDTSYTVSDIYNFFKQGKGTCSGYSLTARILLDICGINSTYGMSLNANHAWNIVRLDGAWYHLDVTWNDPVPDRFGQAGHEYFLISTGLLLQRCPERSDWTSGTQISYTGTIYDDADWSGVRQPYAFLLDLWCYSNNTGIYSAKDPCSRGTLLVEHGQWPCLEQPGYHWSNTYSGLGVYGDCLIYNTANEVKSYNLKTGEIETIYKETYSNKDIYGMMVNGDTATVRLDIHPSCSTIPCATEVYTEVALNAPKITVVASGYCGGEGDGTNLEWTLDSEGTLTISGTGVMKDYKSTTVPWKNHKISIERVVIGNDVTTIGKWAFEDCDRMTVVEIGSKVTAIGERAFSSCADLLYIDIPDSVESIGPSVFMYSDSLVEIVMGSGVKTIGDGAFHDCDGLVSVTLGKSGTTVISSI